MYLIYIIDQIHKLFNKSKKQFFNWISINKRGKTLSRKRGKTMYPVFSYYIVFFYNSKKKIGNNNNFGL